MLILLPTVVGGSDIVLVGGDGGFCRSAQLEKNCAVFNVLILCRLSYILFNFSRFIRFRTDVDIYTKRVFLYYIYTHDTVR